MFGPVLHAAEFKHPGLLHTLDDLNRMKEMVAKGAEPWKSGFAKLKEHPQSQADYTMQGPFDEISRNPTVHQQAFDQDANAAYQCAIVWYGTGDPAYARKSEEIIDGWSGTLKRIGGRDAILAASISPFKMINAAEILRHTKSGWPEASARRADQMFTSVIYPVLETFAPFANGNWDTGAIKTVMAIAVYRDDRQMFERALRYYVIGDGDGRLTHYIYESGQCQESGRDQQHAQLGLGHLGDAAEVAWNQGIDLYSYSDNRLLKGFEYTARYNLGEEVPFEPDIDQTGQYAHQKISERGTFRPIYEEIFNHYVNRMGLEAPYVQRVVERIRPEGAAFGADHPGFGTILFARPPGREAVVGTPGGLVARGEASQIRLSWVPARGVSRYTIRRDGKDLVILDGTTYVDPTVKGGRVYRYSVSGSVEIGVSAGLPPPWTGDGQFDGETFRVEGTITRPLEGDGAITARFVPQAVGVKPQFGVVLGGSSLLLSEVSGRLLEACWLRLVRTGQQLEGFKSPDGQHWTRVTVATGAPTERVGMMVSSGVASFDRVVVTSRGR